MKLLAKILNLGNHAILARDSNVLRGSPLPLLGENDLPSACRVPMGVIWCLEQSIGLGGGQILALPVIRLLPWPS